MTLMRNVKNKDLTPFLSGRRLGVTHFSRSLFVLKLVSGTMMLGLRMGMAISIVILACALVVSLLVARVWGIKKNYKGL